MQPTDLMADSEKLLIKIRQSKTNQLGKCNEALIARTGSITCPVAMLKKYLSLGGIALFDGELLYHGVLKTISGKRAEIFRWFTYVYQNYRTVARKIVQLGYSPDSSGIHILRTVVLLQRPMQEWCTGFSKSMAGGRFDRANLKDHHIKDLVEKRLGLSKQLRL